VSLRVRSATIDDVDAIAPLFDAYRGFYGQPSDRARARRWIFDRLSRNEATVLIAELDGVAVGFTQLYPFWSSVWTARVLVLNDLYVAPGGRRQGAASALLEAAAALGREQGALRLVLETGPDNHEAQALYRRAGWTQEDSLWFRFPLLATPPLPQSSVAP
jgi:ribosomal protein S18 acetylase RimI-like enzyme